MAKLEYSEIKPKKIIIYKGEPHEVLEYYISKENRRKPQNQTKLRDLIHNRVIPIAFHASDTVEEADISKKEVKFIYANKDQYWFCDLDNPSNRFTIPNEIIAESKKFLKENTSVDIKIWTNDDEEEKIIGMTLPIKIKLLVTEAPPTIKGNTASGGGKVVTLETGMKITVPFFIEAGESVLVNTETEEYVERAK